MDAVFFFTPLLVQSLSARAPATLSTLELLSFYIETLGHPFNNVFWFSIKLDHDVSKLDSS